jgi:phage terminase large subunit-like protein
MAIIKLSREEQIELLMLKQVQAERKAKSKIDYCFPDKGERRRELYPKQLKFFKAGATHKQRLFMAANRVGKSFGMGCELTWHLTGRYPKWFEGKRFNDANEWWVCGVDSKAVKEVLQDLLIGRVGEFGEGLIPYECLDRDTMKEAQRMETPINSFRVKHITGAWSTVEFKSYAMGREAFQGTARSIWLDEECPESIYAECFTRTLTGGNILVMTFTPLKGPTPLITKFLGDVSVADIQDGPIDKHRHVTTCTWDDIPHMTENDKAAMASYSPHQRDARSKGIPALGSGVIYPVPLSEYVVKPFEIPKHWKKCYGMDVGGKTAAVWLALDPDTKVTFAYADYYKERAEPVIHAAGIKAKGEWIKGAIDPASRGRSQVDGKALMDMYIDNGLHVVPAVNAVETGLYEVWEALSTGKLKVFDSCRELLREIQIYMRDEKGNVVKKNDHVMDAFRYAYMTRDIAQTEMESKPSQYDFNVSQQYRVSKF